MTEQYDQDTWVMLNSTVRYSMGRSTYMSGYCLNLYKRFQKQIAPHNRKQIRDEVAAELKFAESCQRYLGHACDHQAWMELVQYIETEEGLDSSGYGLSHEIPLYEGASQ